MKLGIDIDNCLTKTQSKICEILKQKYNKDVTPDDIMDYDWSKCFLITQDEIKSVLDEFHINCFDLEAKNGSIEAIQNFKKIHEIHIITARDPELSSEATKKWLEKNQVPYNSLHFASNKLPIGIELNLDLLVEDNGETAVQFAEYGIKTILLDYPWNQKFQHNKIFRVKDWKEVTSLIEEEHLTLL